MHTLQMNSIESNEYISNVFQYIRSERFFKGLYNIESYFVLLDDAVCFALSVHHSLQLTCNSCQV